MRASRHYRVATIAALAVVAVLVLSMLSAIGSASFLAAPQGPSSHAPTVSHSAPAAPVIRAPAAATKPNTASPHPGTLDVYESTGDGTTVDPSAAYYTVNAEPIWNVYETLIAYNGTQDASTPSSYVPQAATCVPGSNECLAQFGSDLVTDNSTTGLPQYFTFEIDANARFYDPATSVSWPVYPSDVVFSLARTMAFSDIPGSGVYNGWINTQDLVPGGNGAWDGGLHAPWNNTPNNILSAFIVNSSTYCPTSTVVKTNGCVTFDTGGSGTYWPFFLELVADPMGASVQSCGWATYTAGGPYMGAPNFAGTNASKGDGPCLLPGNFTSTTPAYYSYVKSLSPTSWDTYELQGDNYPSPQAPLQWNMVGSGPYYNMNPVDPSTGYFLRANPAYVAPQGCAGQLGCLPAPGHYQPNVNVYWAGTDTAFLQQASAGYADTGTYYPTDTAVVKQIVNEGHYGMETGLGTLSIYFDPFELNFSLTNLAKQDTVNEINVPQTYLSNVGLREFLVNAFPYATDEASVQTIDGIQYGEHYGGMIPIGMGNYYPTNISWPSGNPTSNPTQPGNVTWWWNQLTSTSSPWYDPTFAACTSSSPCKFPFTALFEGPTIGISEQNWITSIEQLTNNAVQPYIYTIHAGVEASNVGLPPGDGNMPTYSYGWAPDYPDPSDYVGPMYYPDNTYTYTDAVNEQLTSAAYDNPTACGHAMMDPTVNYPDAWANLTYWASGSGGVSGVGITNQCQGVAYTGMWTFMNYATHNGSLTTRTLIWNVAEHIANELALYVYWDQALGVAVYGIWINPAGINTNVMIGGGGDQLWAFWNYESNFFSATFTETGLPSGTTWSATVGGVGTANSTGASISLTGIPNGTYPYSIAFVSGYAVSPASGTLTISGVGVTVSVTFTALTGTQVPVTFGEVGLVSGTNWTLTIDNVGAYSGNNTTAVFALPPGTYHYNASAVAGYTPPTPGGESVVVGTSPVNATITYTGLLFTTYPITFTSTNLPTGQTWGAIVNGYTGYSSSTTSTFYQRNGSFAWSIPSIPGLMASPSSGTVLVNGTGANIAITWTIVGVHYEVTFVEGGLPAGTSWTVNVNSRAIPSTQPYIQVLVVNGTFAWTVNKITGYLASPSSGSVTVSGASPAAIAIEFAPPAPTYNVVFTAQGATVSAWELWINGVGNPETTSSATILLPVGTYTWGVTLPTGYYASPSGGAITVTTSGASQSFTVSQTSTSSTSSGINATTGLSTLAYALIGIFVLLTVVFLVTTLMARRRPPSQPPQSWSPGTEGKGGDSTPPPSS